jgi:hypothetical protein
MNQDVWYDLTEDPEAFQHYLIAHPEMEQRFIAMLLQEILTELRFHRTLR